MKYYPDNVWICGETYESLKWKDKTDPKPTQEYLESLGQELKKR